VGDLTWFACDMITTSMNYRYAYCYIDLVWGITVQVCFCVG
jgi:hypothetical protein